MCSAIKPVCRLKSLHSILLTPTRNLHTSLFSKVSRLHFLGKKHGTLNACERDKNIPHQRKIGFFQRLFCTDVDCKSPEDVAHYLKDRPAKRIVVMAGAGISTPSGIPDFRSPGTGLYDNLQKYNLPYPEAVFDIGYFDRDPSAFFTLAQELYPSGNFRPNVTHYFVRLLHEKGLLLRMYTQNIDGLERLAGIPEDSLVEAHGTFTSATCRVCLKKYKGADIEESIFKQEIPKCTTCSGVVKPNIVFFGEQLPSRFWNFSVDMPSSDLLIILGTSLEVEPFASIASSVLPGTPRILFNLQATGPFQYGKRRNDVVFEGDLVENIWKFADFLGWQNELTKCIDNHEQLYKQKKEDNSRSREPKG